jgi:iron(III) transport system ATP-binding protein
VRGLRKSFAVTGGQQRALADLDLEVAVGEFFTLLGPSGCGKTTLLRCIAGLEEPDAGDVELDGQLLNSVASGRFMPAEDRPISMVFQTYAIWPHLSVYENVAFPLRHGSSARPVRKEIDERVADALHLVRLDGFGPRSAALLSGGQHQRVALARAIIRRPRLLLMDEPLSNLDAKLREEMRFEIKELTQKLGTTTLHVTHDQGEALALADRMAVMQGGEILEIGEPAAIYRTPRTRFAAAFLGHMNWIDGEVTAEGEVSTPLGIVCIDPDEQVLAGAPVTIGIRPEAMAVVPVSGRSGGGPGGRVVSQLFAGDGYFVTVEIKGIRLLLKSASQLGVDERLDLALPEGPCLVFPREAGQGPEDLEARMATAS